jgi:hypothetical protein
MGDSNTGTSPVNRITGPEIMVESFTFFFFGAVGGVVIA